MDKDSLERFYLVKEKTKKGYSIANINDSVDITRPNDLNRHGRVGKNITHTLTTQNSIGVVVD